jgi:starvation-inducible DNA-binding protein
VADYPLALDAQVRATSVEVLHHILADTMVLRDLDKKHHWQGAGHTFYLLHLLFAQYDGEQSALVDTLAERMQSLEGHEYGYGVECRRDDAPCTPAAGHA